MRAERNARPPESLPLLPCVCANLRRAARAVSRLYNQELRPEGIEITQFTLLMALDTAGQTSQGRLAELLAFDSTTLTRTMELLKKRGWVQVKEGDDRRLRIFCLTKSGREKFQQSSRCWKRAQQRLSTSLGEEVMKELGGLLSEVTRASVRT